MNDALITVVVLAGVLLGLTLLATGPDMVLLAGLAVLLATGVLPTTDALGGFANEGVVTIGALFVVAEGLNQTGAVSFFGQQLLGMPKSLAAAQLRLMSSSAVLSGFMNNTPVVAMMMPIVTDWARKLRMSVSQLLLPLSYATIMGGLWTLIGTSTTLVVNGLLIEETAGVRKFGMFELAWVGVPITVVGLGYLAVCSRWLLPERKPAFAPLDDPREYTVEMIVEPGSPLVGRTIEEAGLRHLPETYLMEIDRAGRVMAAVSPNERLEANDRLVFVGVVSSVVDLQRLPGLKPATDQVFKLDAPRSERCLIEAVVSNTCPIIHQTIRDARFRTHYNAAVIAVARNGERINKKIGDIEINVGDTLLLEADPSFVDLQRNSRDFFLVGQVANSSPPRHELAWVARLLLAAMVVSAATGLLTMLQAALLAAAGMILCRCCRSSDARRSIDLSVLLAIGAAWGIGRSLEITGIAQTTADTLIAPVGDDPLTALIIIYGVTMLLTNLITNTAAAVLVFPIAAATATRLGVDVMPFAVAIAVAAAASFATPIGYQTNLMVYGPGGYRYSDYVRIGAPLSLIVWAVTSAVIPLVWEF